MILMEMMLDELMEVVDMAVDKVADKATDMVAERNDFTDVTLVSEDTF